MTTAALDTPRTAPSPDGPTLESDGPRVLQVLLVALFLLALASVSMLRGLDAARAGAAPSPFAAFADAAARALERGGGPLAVNRRLLAAIDAFEGDLESSSPLRTRALPAIQWVQVAWGGVGNESVYLGRDGWLVFRDGYDTVVGPPFLAPAVLERRRDAAPSWRERLRPDPRPAIRDFARQLAARGIDLVVVLVPTKLTVHPEALSARSLGAPQNPSFDDLAVALERLDEGGSIEVVDTTPTLVALRDAGTPAFLRTDSHWTPAAVDAAAQEVAARLRARAGGAASATASGEAVWWRRAPRRVEAHGDLYRLLRLPPELGPRRYAAEAVEIQVVSTADDRLWRPQRGASVLLLGDSFTNVFSESVLGWGEGGGFGEQLSYHLGRRIDRLAVNDGSASVVRERLAADPERLASTRVVVWQIAARELAGGDWRPITLPLPATR